MLHYKRFAMLISLISYMLLLSAFNVQQEGYTLVFSSIFSIENVSWTNDGSLLTFQEANGTVGVQNLETNNWHAYNVDRQTLTNSSLWPQPLLTPSDNQDSTPNLTNDISFSFLSPENRYLVYSTELSGDLGTLCSLLAIEDTESHSATMVEGVTLCDTDHFENGFNIQWSADETAYTVYTALPTVSNAVYYISSYAEALDKITATDITEFSVDGAGYGVTRAFGLNIDGSVVLVSTTTHENDETISALVAYDIHTPEQSQVVVTGNSVVGATFLRNDDQYLWYVGEEGVAQYNLNTSETTILEPDINSTWVNKVWFSPDGKHIALYEKQGLQEHNLYVVDVPAA